ncbi:hypothetical protein BJV82DRAFT_636185 [Fennellomyces sp. T-0311]|nr:hypothetical protein BJV82DRAFT_636185 [Fennellomyces sp. T-0311]
MGRKAIYHFIASMSFQDYNNYNRQDAQEMLNAQIAFNGYCSMNAPASHMSQAADKSCPSQGRLGTWGTPTREHIHRDNETRPGYFLSSIPESSMSARDYKDMVIRSLCYIGVDTPERVIVKVAHDRGYVNSPLDRTPEACPPNANQQSDNQTFTELQGTKDDSTDKGSLDNKRSPEITSSESSKYCRYCGKGFNKVWDCIRHEETIHRKERKHQCGVCKERFTRKDVLLKHWRRKKPCQKKP